MRKHTNIPEKTIDFVEIISAAKKLISSGILPRDVLFKINNEYLSPCGIKYILENSHHKKTHIPDISYQTDEIPAKEPEELRLPNKQSSDSQYSDSQSGELQSDDELRIIFVCNRASRDHKIQAASEANGIVVGYDTWKVISYPPAALSFNMSEDTIVKYLGDGTYKIYYIDFGTIVTLHYFNNSWRLSSANGYEIDDKIWIGDKTFRNLINEVLEKYRIDVNSLNKEWCYSFGFHHYEYHPFDGAEQNSIRAWFIRAVNIKEYNNTLKLITANNNVISNKIPMQREAVDLNKLAAINPKNALESMKKICNMSYTKFVNDRKTTPNYGFVLLSNKPELIADVLLESDLQKKLRKFVCRRPPNDLEPSKRFNWMMINASIDKIEDCSEFRRLFPHTIDSGKRFDELIKSIAVKIVGIYNKEETTFGDNQIDHIVKFVIEQMKKQSHFINKKADSIGIVEDYLRNRTFAYLYATII